MADDKAKKDDKATKRDDAAKKPDNAAGKPISDEDAQSISGGLARQKINE